MSCDGCRRYDVMGKEMTVFASLWRYLDKS